VPGCCFDGGEVVSAVLLGLGLDFWLKSRFLFHIEEASLLLLAGGANVSHIN
jgi:hypothetical protein